MATAESPTLAPTPQEAPEAPRRWRFDVEQYYRLAEVGILKRGDRVELIDGDILVMCPIGNRHHGCVNDLNYLLVSAVGARAVVSVQGPLRLNDRSEPQPDVALLRPRPDSYRSAHPVPSDALLVIEVMDSSASYDRNVKLGLYARSAVPEVWLVDLNAGRVEAYRRPEGGVYAEKSEAARGQFLSPEAFPDVVIGVDAILG
jgi:Uma2 family endonuclease